MALSKTQSSILHIVSILWKKDRSFLAGESKLSRKINVDLYSLRYASMHIVRQAAILCKDRWLIS